MSKLPLSNASPWTRFIALILVTALAVYFGYMLPSFVRIFKSNKKDTVPAVLESVALMNDLHLAKYYYEAIIPVYKDYKKGGKPKGRLQFVAICPAEIHGYIDLSQIDYEIKSDSLVEVSLPAARLTEPVIHLDSLRQYAIRHRGFALRLPGLSNSKMSIKAFGAIQSAIVATKTNVREKALANGILYRSEKLARLYLQNLLNQVGYKVKFINRTATTKQLLSGLSGEEILEQLPLLQRQQLIERIQNQVSKLSNRTKK